MNSISIFLILVGITFDLFGCIGLLRLPDIYNRLQSATKCVTLGTCSILLALFIQYGFTAIGIKALIAIPLLFFASTGGAHILIRGAYKYGLKLTDKTVIDDYKEVDQ
ncbi:MAG: monovalent cation/H(+) antiporter subunit G, partial [Candidatus Cloacimonadaceae bacterium]|nr:monovalent cation/H(+) antiporter subunit G [Candidatus Cloacimonadaceae bacterium]